MRQSTDLFVFKQIDDIEQLQREASLMHSLPKHPGLLLTVWRVLCWRVLDVKRSLAKLILH